jgi:import inner membrane translocase subunit TIM44
MGLNMDSMPFLTETVSRLVGESEIAQCTREMKAIDPSFRLSHLFDEVEQIVIPKFLQWFLEGDALALKLHCGEAAFAAVNNSIKSRVVQKCKPDTRVLLGPRDIELRLAVPQDLDSSPCFVFQFTTQQVNCFKEYNGNVVEGSADDIREMHYMIAIQRNLAEDQSKLEHPWLIRELAIVGNRRTW